MKVLVTSPGHLRTVPVADFVLRALRESGIETHLLRTSMTPLEKAWKGIRHGLGLRKWSLDYAHVNRRLKRWVEVEKPDLLLCIFGFDLFPETLEFVRRRGVTTVCWWLNDPIQFDRSLKQLLSYDFYFTNSRGSVEDYRRAGKGSVHYLPAACSPAVHRRLELDPKNEEKFESEVCFAGDWGPVREAVLTRLVPEFDLSIWGPWRRKLSPSSPLYNRVRGKWFTPEEMTRIFNGTNVVLNLHSWFGKFECGTNPRLFEAAGCGAFQLCDWKSDIPYLFTLQEEMVCYRSLDELKEQLRYFLKDDAARKQIGERARQRAMREHTYQDRIMTILEIVEKGGS
jgi:spore maturation protein CgeB